MIRFLSLIYVMVFQTDTAGDFCVGEQHPSSNVNARLVHRPSVASRLKLKLFITLHHERKLNVDFNTTP